jgi:hypothetical protein
MELTKLENKSIATNKAKHNISPDVQVNFNKRSETIFIKVSE